MATPSDFELLSKFALVGLVIGAMAVSTSARAQEMASNPNMVKRGKEAGHGPMHWSC